MYSWGELCVKSKLLSGFIGFERRFAEDLTNAQDSSISAFENFRLFIAKIRFRVSDEMKFSLRSALRIEIH